jgi:hypothetical protein
MNNDIPISEPRAISKFLNIALMLLNVYLAISLYSILDLTRSWYIGVDPSTGKYASPSLSEFLLKKEFIVIPILLLGYMIYKEFKVKPLKKRVRINLLILAGILSHSMLIAAVPFIFSLV